LACLYCGSLLLSRSLPSHLSPENGTAIAVIIVPKTIRAISSVVMSDMPAPRIMIFRSALDGKSKATRRNLVMLKLGFLIA
ncbi:MAG: hypothetical protein ABSE82_16460, partial [Nitrososphaerales archaeon]